MIESGGNKERSGRREELIRAVVKDKLL